MIGSEEEDGLTGTNPRGSGQASIMLGEAMDDLVAAISDEEFVAAVDEAIRLRSEDDDGRPWDWATRWDVAAVLAGHPEHVACGPFDYPHMPEAAVLAKAESLIARGLIDGCSCGCRGEFARE